MFNKRIENEISQFNQLKSNSIFINKDNNKMYVMIIGNYDTIYRHGFYFFTITFPSDYPFSPPKVLFYTPDKDSRFNPHLFNNGYVCMSSLEKGTQNGWTPIRTFYSILQSIESLILNNGSIDNELRDNKEYRYFDYIIHQNIKYALINQYLNTPREFLWAKPIMKNYIKQNKMDIITYINELKYRVGDNKMCTYICPETHETHSIYTNYSGIKNILNQVFTS
jgi:ubiquitin-protein ligase